MRRKASWAGLADRMVIAAVLCALVCALIPMSALAATEEEHASVPADELVEASYGDIPEYGRIDTWGLEDEDVTTFDARALSSEQASKLQAALRSAYDSFADTVRIQALGITMEEVDAVKDVLLGVLDDSTYWYAMTSFSCRYYPSSGLIAELKLHYLVDDLDELSACISQLNDTVAEALMWVDPDMSDVEKAQAMHDYLVRTCAYVNDDSMAQYSAYGPLVLKKGVCQGYALAYKLLLTKLGIHCIYVSSDEMNHGWNMVQLDGQWYHVDVTWDDPLYHGIGDLGFDIEGTVVKVLSHENFLRGDDEIAETGHSGWVSAYEAPVDYFAHHDQVSWPIYRGPQGGVPDPSPTKPPAAKPEPEPTPDPIIKPDPKPSDPQPSTQDKSQIMHRLYNPNSGEHFYTASSQERDMLSSVGWEYEGTAWDAPSSGEPVYRMYNANAGDHHYTPSAAERDSLVSVGWSYEGIGWFSDADKGTPLFRLYNPNAIAGSHHYTTSAGERDSLKAVGWHDEGIGWYGR